MNINVAGMDNNLATDIHPGILFMHIGVLRGIDLYMFVQILFYGEKKSKKENLREEC
jgi:hypothetical protein|tara:strand:- start:542 stop:712 length:171 start_codon:yes stop_codon:yes gene_type:complete